MKKLLAVMLSVIMVFSFAACAGKSVNNEGESQTEETTTIRIGAMAGPTAMGMVKLRKDSENGNTKNTYAFEDFATDASAFVTPLATGEIDIAAVPSNLAANIYNKTEGKVQVVAVNTLGVLNLVERGNTVNSISDLKGKTIYATGMGAVPEYTIRYILSGNGLDADKDVDIVWCSDTTEALSVSTTVSVSVSAASSVLSATSTTTACCPLRLSAVPASAKADNVDGIINAMTHIADINFFIFLYSFVVSISVIIISYSSLPVAPSKCNLFSQIYGYFFHRYMAIFHNSS